MTESTLSLLFLFLTHFKQTRIVPVKVLFWLINLTFDSSNIYIYWGWLITSCSSWMSLVIAQIRFSVIVKAAGWLIISSKRQFPRTGYCSHRKGKYKSANTMILLPPLLQLHCFTAFTTVFINFILYLDYLVLYILLLYAVSLVVWQRMFLVFMSLLKKRSWPQWDYLIKWSF